MGRTTLIKKAKELAKKSGVQGCIFLKDDSRLDGYYSDDKTKERVARQLKTILMLPSRKKTKVQEASCSIVRVKKLTKDQINSKFTIYKEDGQDSSQEDE